jgi:hypothetical protein
MVPDFHDGDLGRSPHHVESLLALIHGSQRWPVVLPHIGLLNIGSHRGRQAGQRRWTFKRYGQQCRVGVSQQPPHTLA